MEHCSRADLTYPGCVHRVVALLAAAAVLALPGSARSDLNQGPQTILVILVTWGPQPFTPAQIRQSVFEEADAYVRSASFGKTSLTGDVTTWLPVREFDNCDPVSQSEMALAALNAAKAAGYDNTKYSRFIFGFPSPRTCRLGGIGAANHVWMLGNATPRIVIHELGHTFGFGHAWSIGCARCRPVEYGDPYDEMGHGLGDYNAFEKVIAGWITPVPAVSANGEYVIDQLERASAQPQMLRVTTAHNDYWFDHREPLGGDAGYAGDAVVRGVEVHASPSAEDDGSSVYQPGNVLVLDPTGSGANAILPGASWGETGAFRITVLAHEGTSMRVRFEWTDTVRPTKPPVYNPVGVVRSRLHADWGRARDDGSGVAAYEVRLDEKLLATTDAGARTLPLKKPSRGRHRVTVVAIDRAGNRSAAGATTFKVR
jgi:hypothetical protein